MVKQLISQFKTNSVFGYVIAFIIGLILGLDYAPQILINVLYLTGGFICLFLAPQKQLIRIFSILPYLVYTEIYIRGNPSFVPYLYVQYLIIAIFLILIFTQSSKPHSLAFLFMIFFAVIEIINAYRTTDLENARALIINTLAITVIVTWASLNFLVPIQINAFLNHVKFASIYLCGIVLAAHFTGKIDYGLTSSAASMNGLAPVQISGYLGFSCFVFFLSVMSNDERKNLILNIILLAITSVVMLLSFSRGGLYFLGIMSAVYLLFNRSKLKNYFLFLLMLPVALIVYYYVTETTNGLIEQRYAEEGTSGRTELLQAGIHLFEAEPLIGVGTGNFNSEIIKRNLYQVQSGAHDEFIRVAAEHGLPGVITYWGFFLTLFFEIFHRKKIQKEYGIYFLLFFILITIHNGLKISLQPLLLLFAVATPSLIKIKRKVNASAQKQLAS